MIYHGDCLEVLRTLPDCSVDAVVTDPPYGLSFMGKKWDYDVPSVEVWAECLRVLKPGGHLLAFAGTRTQHRMAVRIEDAGFEIRDMIAWVYGCLSEDSEVLTEDGWMPYNRAKQKNILAYDLQNDIYQWERPSRWNEYRVESDTAYRIQSDHTDQIVSRGHRCIVERGGVLEFVPADELTGVERVPYLQGDFSALPQGRGELLFQAVLREGEGLAQEAFSQRQREETAWQGARRVQESCMERRADPLQAQGQVPGSVDQIRSMPCGTDEHGPQGRLCDGASAGGCAGDWASTDATGVRASHQPRRDGQPAGKPDAVCQQRGSQAVRARPSYQTTVATVTAIEYSGMIWCPTVSTGAFVARRNGKVFITGNSGFPKSLDVSKAIDRAAGAEREVVGVRTDGRGASPQKLNNHGKGDTGIGHADGSKQTYFETAPATDAARQWQGWGTALKPALETVTLASKPYTAEQERDIIQSNLIRLEARLWLLSSASAAEKSSTSSQSEYGAACAIAQWSADEITSTRAALCDPMGTSLFELATNISLNIVSSWRRTLDESWSDGNTSTTETKLSTTIDWKTLKFSLSQITPESIIKACGLSGGFSANASTAENHFNASLSLLQSIRTLSATEPAISQEAENCRGADVKPNLDPCIMARKPLVGTAAENVLAHGTGALNIDGCRVPTADDLNGGRYSDNKHGDDGNSYGSGINKRSELDFVQPAGRWPANLIHDGSDEVVGLFPGEGDKSAARFMYCAKASKKDRDEGLEEFEVKRTGGMQATADGSMLTGSGNERTTTRANIHPTVKPTDLMRYLCRLITPPGGTVLDPFMGSGSTGKAAVLEGLSFIGIEREAAYVEIAKARIAAVQAKPKQEDLF